MASPGTPDPLSTLLPDSRTSKGAQLGRSKGGNYAAAYSNAHALTQPCLDTSTTTKL
jgi:hypothetical protein